MKSGGGGEQCLPLQRRPSAGTARQFPKLTASSWAVSAPEEPAAKFVLQHVTCEAAEQHLAQATVRISTHHKQADARAGSADRHLFLVGYLWPAIAWPSPRLA
jgi:hypothetical protein